MECLQKQHGTKINRNTEVYGTKKWAPRKMQREDGKEPNGRQLCSKSRPGSELRNSTADICIRTWPHSPFFSLSVLQILRHPRPTETPPSIPKTAGSNFIKRTAFCYHRLQRKAVNANLNRGIPRVSLILTRDILTKRGWTHKTVTVVTENIYKN